MSENVESHPLRSKESDLNSFHDLSESYLPTPGQQLV